MAILSRRKINFNNKTPSQLKLLNGYFFPHWFSALKLSDKHYYDLVLEKKDSFKCLNKAINKLALNNVDLEMMAPIESLCFSYDGDYCYKNGNSSKVKYTCLFLGPKQIYAYNYEFDMVSDNFKESANEIFYNSIIAVETEEKYNDKEFGLCGFISEKGKRTINTVITLKIITSGGEFDFEFKKAPEVEFKLQQMRSMLRGFRTIRAKKSAVDQILDENI